MFLSWIDALFQSVGQVFASLSDWTINFGDFSVSVLYVFLGLIILTLLINVFGHTN